MDPEKKIILTDEQQWAVQMVKDNRVSIITGGPGTGKTTTCKAILQWAQNSNLEIKCCAPSGKAAKRMQEATGFESYTIHRSLEAQMREDNFFFGRNELIPLECDLLIVDEVSMIPNGLMADLLRAVKPGSKLLLIGDQDQLPSIGAGAVLRDFLASGLVPHIELTKIHRNAGDIVKSCKKIKQGLFYNPSCELNPINGSNLRHIEISDPEKILDCIREIVINRMPARGYDPVWDVQIISPVNNRSALSCRSINKMLQAELNPNSSIDGLDFRLGDKVIQTKNRHVELQAKPPRKVHSADSYVVNGDLGHITLIEQKSIHVKFFHPNRDIVFPLNDHNLLLAYCITCHRMQGSEAKVVIIPIHKTFNYILNRPWIYTALSRAQDICITIGQFAAIKTAIKKENGSKRLTRLKERLDETFRDYQRYQRKVSF